MCIFTNRKWVNQSVNKNRKTNYVSWNAAKAESAVEQFVEKQGRFPVAREMNRKNGLPSRRTFEMKVGISMFEYGKQYHPELVKQNATQHRQRVADSMREKSEWTKETLIAAVKHFVDQHNRLPDIQEYTPQNGLPSYTTFCRIAKTALADYLKEYFCEYMNQTLTLKENGADAIEQDESSPGMTMTL